MVWLWEEDLDAPEGEGGVQTPPRFQDALSPSLRRSRERQGRLEEGYGRAEPEPEALTESKAGGRRFVSQDLSPGRGWGEGLSTPLLEGS